MPLLPWKDPNWVPKSQRPAPQPVVEETEELPEIATHALRDTVAKSSNKELIDYLQSAFSDLGQLLDGYVKAGYGDYLREAQVCTQAIYAVEEELLSRASKDAPTVARAQQAL